MESNRKFSGQLVVGRWMTLFFVLACVSPATAPFRAIAVPLDLKESCLGCHPYESIFQATAHYKTPDGVNLNPHVTIDFEGRANRFSTPHVSGKGVVECTYCHQQHPAPPIAKGSVPKAKADYCLANCHHTGDVQPCKDCHNR